MVVGPTKRPSSVDYMPSINQQVNVSRNQGTSMSPVVSEVWILSFYALFRLETMCRSQLLQVAIKHLEQFVMVIVWDLYIHWTINPLYYINCPDFWLNKWFQIIFVKLLSVLPWLWRAMPCTQFSRVLKYTFSLKRRTVHRVLFKHFKFTCIVSFNMY